jgi:GT2 family glycosyltransferase
MKIAIVIATYQRKDGKTKFYLERALNSLILQSSKNFKIFLIGDKYEDSEEFFEYSKLIENGYIENLSQAKERDKYVGKKLWCSGGVNAMNHGINLAIKDGYNYIINLDHDDYFLPEHISDITKIIIEESPIFVCSKSTHFNSVLPNISDESRKVNFIPKSSGLIKSSACIDFSRIDLRFRDVFEETGNVYPSDADFWNRLGKFISDNSFKSFCMNNLTCIHDTEGYSLTIN